MTLSKTEVLLGLSLVMAVASVFITAVSVPAITLAVASAALVAQERYTKHVIDITNIKHANSNFTAEQQDKLNGLIVSIEKLSQVQASQATALSELQSAQESVLKLADEAKKQISQANLANGLRPFQRTGN